MVSALILRSRSPGWALAGDTVLCSKARHFTVTLRCINGYCAIVGKPNKLQGSGLQWTSILSRGSRSTHSHFMLQKRDNLLQLWASLAQKLRTLLLVESLKRLHCIYPKCAWKAMYLKWYYTELVTSRWKGRMTLNFLKLVHEDYCLTIWAFWSICTYNFSLYVLNCTC